MLPKTAEYALRAVVWLAGAAGRREAADELAERTKIPRRYLHKVLQALVQAGLVDSQPGPRGGYALSKPAPRITILAVVNAVAPVERIRACPLGLTSHTRLCPLHKELDRVYAEIEKSFGKVTVAELLHSTSKIVPLCEGPRR
jgi:Rrf2 family protein